MCALAEIQYTATTTADILVYTDICDSSIVNSTKLPILRRLRVRQGTKNIVFNLLHYYPIKIYNIDKIRVYINPDIGETSTVLQDKLNVTLHFCQSS